MKHDHNRVYPPPPFHTPNVRHPPLLPPVYPLPQFTAKINGKKTGKMLFQQRVEQPNAVKQSKNAYFDAGFLVPNSQLQNRANYRIFRKISNWF